MRILIADDHPLVRAGVRTALSRDERLEVVGEAADGDETLSKVIEYRPDLLLLDISMPGLTADQVVLRAAGQVPEMKTLILTAHDDDVYVRQLSRVPISGYLLKDEALENLLQAVRVVGQGAVWFSQSVARKITSLAVRSNEGGLRDLTARELDLLGGISRGETNTFISKRLHLAEQTVRNYICTLYQKIGVNSRIMAAVWARERGIQ